MQIRLVGRARRPETAIGRRAWQRPRRERGRRDLDRVSMRLIMKHRRDRKTAAAGIGREQKSNLFVGIDFR
jgi:hypothetical protein